MAIDGFLEIYTQNKKLVEGECLDFHAQGKERPISIQSFKLKTEDSDKKTKKKGKDKDKKGGKVDDSNTDPPEKPKGKAKFPVTLEFTKDVDSSTPALFLSYCTHGDGDEKNDIPFKLVRITLRKGAGGQPMRYLMIEVGQAFVTKYEVKTDEDKLPSESIEIIGEWYHVHYRPQKLEGKGKWHPAGWDFKKKSPDIPRTGLEVT